MSDPSNMQDGLLLHHLSKILKAEAVKAAAAKDLADVRKLAKSDGVDLKTLDLVRKMLGADHFELATAFNDLVRYAKVLDLPVYSQLSLFSTADEVDEDEILDRAFVAGRRAGKTGLDQSTCPHGFETPAGQQWLDGWGDGQRILFSAIKQLEPVSGKLDKDDFDDAEAA